MTHDSADSLRELARMLWKNANLFVPLTLLGLLVNVAGCLGSLRIIVFVEDADVIGWDMSSGAMLNNAAGLMIFLFATTFGPLLVGLALPHLTGFTRCVDCSVGKPWGLIVSGTTHFGIVAGCVLAVSYAAADLIQATRTFNLEPGGPDVEYPAPSAIRQFMGGWLVTVYTMLGIAVLSSALLPYIQQLRQHLAPPRLVVSSPLHPGLWHAIPLVAFGSILLGLLLFSTTILGPLWNTPGFLYIPFGPPVNETEDGVLEWYSLSDATLRVGPTQPCVEDERCSDSVIHFKVYKDVLVFFGFILGVSLTAFAGSMVPAVRRLLHHTVWLTPPKSTPRRVRALIEDWSRGVGVGELAVVLGFFGLAGWWFYYFAVEFDWIEDKARTETDPHASLYIYSRVMGHMTNLCMAFLLLPVARNSFWEACFGIPFDRAIKYHRVLGMLTWAAVTCHMLTWQVKWLMEGNLANNVITLTSLAVGPEAIHTENFTIPLAEFGWLTLTIVLIIAIWGRRWSYWLFHASHHLVWVYLFVALIHAWSHWYYVAGGLILYVVDKLTRAIKSSGDVRVVSMKHAAGVTRIELDVGKAGSLFAGQFAFLCIPAVNPLQWHPFTVSSPPSSVTSTGTITFHIKAVGPWTRKLAALALTNGVGDALSSMHASVDGFYGRSGDFYESSSLLLVAGGIGITPMLALFQELHARAVHAAKSGTGETKHVQHVRLIWVIREVELLVAFASQIAPILRDNCGGAFSCALHVTGSAAGLPEIGDALECDCESDAPALAASPAPSSACTASVAGASEEGGVSIELTTPGALLSKPCHLELAHAGWCDEADARLVLSSRASGRPKLDDEFVRASDRASPSPSPRVWTLRPRPVTALVCGPSPLADEVASLAAKHGTGFHCEVFSF